MGSSGVASWQILLAAGTLFVGTIFCIAVEYAALCADNPHAVKLALGALGASYLCLTVQFMLPGWRKLALIFWLISAIAGALAGILLI